MEESLIEEIKVLNSGNDMFGTYDKAIAICNFLQLENNKKLLEKNNLKVLVKFKKICNNTNIIYKNNKKEEYIYTVFKEKRSQWL